MTEWLHIRKRNGSWLCWRVPFTTGLDELGKNARNILSRLLLYRSKSWSVRNQDMKKWDMPLMLWSAYGYYIIKGLLWLSRAVGHLCNLVKLVVGFRISRVVEKPFHSTVAAISLRPHKPKANVIQSTMTVHSYSGRMWSLQGVVQRSDGDP